MVASVTLKHPLINSGAEVRVLCSNISISGSCNINAKPNAYQLTSHEPGEAQKISTENLRYSISGVHFTNQSGTFKYIDLLTLYKSRFAAVDDATYPEIELRVIYGSTPLVSGTMTVNQVTQDTVINVLLTDFSFPIDVTDSREGYMPVGTMNFVETV